MKATIDKIREETWLSKGTAVLSNRWGVCRVHFLYSDKASLIEGLDKKVGSTGDVWCRIKDGVLVEWNSDDELTLVQC
jgi:hypothetical protein